MSGYNYYYPGTRDEFFNEFGGLPPKPFKKSSVILGAILIIFIVLIILVILLLRDSENKEYVDDTEVKTNLDELVDINGTTTLCCTKQYETTPTTEFIYDSNTGITYSSNKSVDINSVCDTFTDFQTCVENNTNFDGEIIPIATFKLQPYYTFQQGSFDGCTFGPCP